MTHPADTRTPGTITLTRWVWSGGTQDVTGPFVVGQLPPSVAARLDQQLRSSNFFALPSQVTPQNAADSYTTIRVEWDGGYHDVSFSGPPGHGLDQLDYELTRLRTGGGFAEGNGYASGPGSDGGNGYASGPGFAGPPNFAGGNGYPGGSGYAGNAYPEGSGYAGGNGYGGPGPSSGPGYVGGSAPARSSGPNRGLLIGAAAVAVLLVIGVVAVVLTRGGGSSPKNQVTLTPASALVTDAGAGTIRLSWQPGAAADHYLVARDGVVVGNNVRETTYLDLLPDVARHSYTVTAVDSTGKQSAPTAAAGATAETRPLSAAERALVNRLPVDLVDESSCTEAIDGASKYLTETKPGLAAALNCTPTASGADGAPLPDGKMTILQYTSSTTYGSAVSDLKAGKSDGDCSTAKANATTWHFTNPDGSAQADEGALACGFFADSGYAYLSWTYNAAYITMTVYGPTGGSAKDIPNLNKYFIAAPVSLRS